MQHSHLSHSLILPLILIAPPLMLTGCSASFNSNMPPASVEGVALHGGVHGGQQGITGSHVYLYVAGTTGYSSAPTSLLNTADSGVSTDTSGNGYVTTGTNGVWTITGDYTCPSASSLVYLLALGGNPGLGGGGNNAALALLAALGPCSSLSASTFVDINEISTVASAFALSPFATFSTQGIATSSTNILGLTHAFATASSLVNYTTGLARTTTPAGGIVPQTEINTLADILSICVNSNGTTGGCPSLFAAATPTGGTTPTNTLQAALNIARHPASNVTTLFNLQPSTAPFQPVLPVVYNSFTGTYTGVPNDWSIAVTFASSTWNSPEGIAADSQGNIWLVSGTTVAKLDPLGNQLETVSGGQLGANNYNQTLAIDLNDRALIDDNSYWVSLVDSLGNNTTLADPPPPFGGPLNIAGFGGVVVDASNNYWAGSAANNSSALVVFNAGTGAHVTASYTGGGLVNPIGEAIDYSGNIWVTNSNSAFANPGTVSKFSSAGASLAGSTGFSGGGLNGCAGIAIDPSGNAWVTDATANTLTQLSPTGTPSAASPYSGGGLSYPSDIAVDGDGNLWVANFNNSDVSGFSSTGTPLSPTGFYNGLSAGRSGHVTVDASGSVWLSDWSGYVTGSSINGSVTQMVGLAAPTVTPIALALKNHTIGTRP
jgi:streptogramin lyase